MKHTRKIVDLHQRKYKNPLENTIIQVETKFPMKETSKEGGISKGSPLINVVTRTSNRPNGFKRCRESIINQTYKNIRHIVSIDNLADEYYVKDSGADYFFIDKSEVEKMPDIPDPKTGKRFIYNLYFNILFGKVNDGWILIIDDDDYLKSPTIIEEIVSNISSNQDLLIFQMEYENGSVLPTIPEIGQIPRIGRIGSPCIMIHSAIAKTIKWDGWKCGDFRYITQCWKKTDKKIGIKKPVVRIGGQGFGLRGDIKPQRNIETATIVPSEAKIKSQITDTQQKLDQSFDDNGQKLSICIIAVGWNCEKYIGEFFRSINSLKSGNYSLKIYILDDCSTDNTYNLLKKYSEKDSRIKLFKNDKNMGAAYSRFKLLNKLDIDDVAAIVDLDDALSEKSLSLVADIYNKNPNVHCTVGSIKYMSNIAVKFDLFPKYMIDSAEYSGKFLVPPLRTFKAKYFKNIPESLFKDDNGNWYKYCTDVSLMMGIIYQLKSENIFKINEITYLYRDSRRDGTLQKWGYKKTKLRNIIYSKLKKVFNNQII